MNAPQGLCYFPGIEQIVSANMTLTHGRGPSVCTIRMAPQPQLPTLVGPLVYTFDSTQIVLPEARLETASFQRDPGGLLWTVSILDRRWKWQWGAISGTYNQRDANGQIKQGTEKTPQELARLCLEALGEQSYSVGDLPNDSRPFVDWNHDLPAEALTQLAESLGCRLVLQLDNTVALRVVGQGRELDTSYLIDNHYALDAPELPEKIAVICGETQYQVDLELEAVALEIEGAHAGKFVPLDSVTYKPSDGWGGIALPYMESVDIDGTDDERRDRRRQRAQQTVFRAYRPKVPFDVPTFGKVNTLDQITLLDRKARATFSIDPKPDDFDAASVVAKGLGLAEYPVPATVHGVYCQDVPGKFENTAEQQSPNPTTGMYWTKGFSIDGEARVVLFPEPVFKNVATSRVVKAPADLRLQTLITVRDEQTLAPACYVRERETGSGVATPTRHQEHPDLFRVVLSKYRDDYKPEGSDDNKTQLDAACDHYLDAVMHEYRQERPQTLKYPGLWPISPDGAIQQVTWEVGPSGATTIASRNDEGIVFVPSHREARQRQRSKVSNDKRQNEQAAGSRSRGQAANRAGTGIF